jgi:hypothetical protein
MGAEFVREVEPGEIVTLDRPRRHEPAVRPARASAGAVRLRARLLREPRVECLRAERPASPASGSARCSRRGPGGRGPGDADARLGAVRRQRVRARQRAALPRGHRAQPLRRADVHQADAGRAARRRAPQAQRRQRDRRRQARRRRRRLDRPRHDDAREDAAAPRGGREEIHLRISCPPIRTRATSASTSPPRDQLIAHNREIERSASSWASTRSPSSAARACWALSRMRRRVAHSRDRGRKRK